MGAPKSLQQRTLRGGADAPERKTLGGAGEARNASAEMATEVVLNGDEALGSAFHPLACELGRGIVARAFPAPILPR